MFIKLVIRDGGDCIILFCKNNLHDIAYIVYPLSITCTVIYPTSAILRRVYLIIMQKCKALLHPEKGRFLSDRGCFWWN